MGLLPDYHDLYGKAADLMASAMRSGGGVMCCERWSTRKTLTWIRDYHGPDGGDPHENKHRAATEALTLMDERDAAVALLRRLLSESYCRDGGWRCDEWDGTTCTHEQTRAFLTTLTPAEGEV